MASAWFPLPLDRQRTARACNPIGPIRAGYCLRMEDAATGRVQATKCVRLRFV
jgi:hypothetical protein